ncbi:transglutaminase domain-containing protein [Candidatus Bathyarchaeota archaeon]|nr:transglutaminase domain-containing protein [Candidatus Bathyarchaeota archaeon]
MADPKTEALAHYRSFGLMTDPEKHGDLFVGLPSNVEELCCALQGIMIHVFWAERMGVKLSDERKQEVNLRKVADKLAKIREMDSRPLAAVRSPEKRLVGNCRDFAVMLCSMLRSKGISARARCGFATYFDLTEKQDHWICEYWSHTEQRWVMVDPQLDEFQQQALQIRFDPLDMPHGYFLPAGKAWQMCRVGQADPNQFGIFDMHGMWFIRGNLVRDLASLNKVELLPWDCWGLIEKEEKSLSEDDLDLLDHVAELTLSGDSMFDEMRVLYENEPLLHASIIKSYSEGGKVSEVDIRRLR